MEKKDNVFRSRGKIILDNFLGGIAWSLGVWVGTSILIVILAYFLSQINIIPIIGDFVAEISKYAARKTIPFGF